MGFKAKLWLFWFIGTFSGGTALIAAMISPGHQWLFLIGETTSGHYQIELACQACHLSPFGGKEALQKSCVNCHGEELKLAKDSHPAKKFNDPRNADRLQKIDAQLCLTCHREHKPRLTGAMGVTVPGDFCRLCHEMIGEERPSHKGLSFAGCAAAGCHKLSRQSRALRRFPPQAWRWAGLGGAAVHRLESRTRQYVAREAHFRAFRSPRPGQS